MIIFINVYLIWCYKPFLCLCVQLTSLAIIAWKWYNFPNARLKSIVKTQVSKLSLGTFKHMTFPFLECMICFLEVYFCFYCWLQNRQFQAYIFITKIFTHDFKKCYQTPSPKENHYYRIFVSRTTTSSIIKWIFKHLLPPHPKVLQFLLL